MFSTCSLTGCSYARRRIGGGREHHDAPLPPKGRSASPVLPAARARRAWTPRERVCTVPWTHPQTICQRVEVDNVAEQHSHDAQVHDHEHSHVTHYLRGGEQVEHMTSAHSHEHNHAAVSHAHEPHEDPQQEHTREAHIHDHAAPADSPA